TFSVATEFMRNSLASSLFFDFELTKKACTPANGRAAWPPADGIGSMAILMPLACASGTFHGPVMKYGDSPALDAALARSPVRPGLKMPAAPCWPSHFAKFLP